MSSVGIVLTTACANCRENFPVNALAPSVRCPKCGQPVAVDLATWKNVLEAPAIDGHRAEPGKDHVESVSGSITFVRNFMRKDAACARCGGDVPLPKSLAHANRGWCICVHCGDKVSVRALPAEFGGMGGVTHVIGEDFAGIAGAAPTPATSASQGEVVGCPACGSGVPVNGTTRAVVCKHCNSQVVIPDAVWAKLHPLPAQRTFFLWHDPAQVPQATGKMDLAWGSLDDVVADFNGNLYFAGVRDGEGGWRGDHLAIWCTDSQLNLRWKRDPVQIEGKTEDPQLAFSPSGHLLMRCENRHSVVVISCADGSTAAVIGGKEPEGAPAHHLDFENCDTHTCDVDGTILALVHHRVLRWAPDARPLETWPPGKGVFGGEKHQKLKSLFRSDGTGGRDRVKGDAEYPPEIEALKDRPLELYSDYCKCIVGWDGCFYIQRSENVAKLDRSGSVIYRVKIPEGGNDRGRPCADRNGFAYLLRETKHGRRFVFRISPDGKEIRKLIDGTQRGTPVTDSSEIAVLPDGTIFLFSYGGHARIFGADGTMRFASEKARKDDAEGDEEIARDEL